MTDSIRLWWYGLSEEGQARLKRWAPPAGTLILVVAIWQYLNIHGEWITNDRNLIKTIGFASGFAAVVTLLGNRRWSLLRLGLWCYLIGDAGMLIRVLGNVGPQPVGASELNLIRALFSVGVAGIIISSTTWTIRTRAGTHVESTGD